MFLFDISNKEKEISELDEVIAKEGFWDDLDNSQKILQKSKGLKSSVEKYKALAKILANVVLPVPLGPQNKYA